jgi:phosphate uptake regulator
MRRKLIKQGAGGCTLTLPVKWVRENNLKPGDEIDIVQEENKLEISSSTSKKQLKSTQLKLEPGSFTPYRSLIGGLYRGGFDKIEISYDDPAVLEALQEAMQMLVGFDILDITQKKCSVRALVDTSSTDVHSHTLKMVHIINTIMQIMQNDIQNATFKSKEQIWLFRVNALKQRDLIIRSIIQRKEEKIMSYYTLATHLWTVCRNLYYLYKELEQKRKIDTKAQRYFAKVCSFFKEMFSHFDKPNVLKNNQRYRKTVKEGNELLHTLKKDIFVVSYSINMLMASESCNSSLGLMDATR